MILVTGGTGFIGRHLVRRLHAEGRSFRLLLNPSRARQAPSLFDFPVEIIEGSILDDEALFRAVSGAHVIIHLENAQWWGRQRDLERVEVEGIRSLVTAARAARVGRIITLSHLGAAPASAYTLLRVKGLVEEAIRSSGLAYTILRTGPVFGQEDAFVNHIAMQIRANPFFYLMPGRGEIVLHPIYIENIVDALTGALTVIDTVDKVIDIGGPEYISLEDLIRTVMRVSGAGRPIIGIPPYLYRWMTTLSSRLLPRSMITPQWLDLLATNRTARIGNAWQYFAMRPLRLEDTLLTYMRGRPYARMLLRRTFRRRPRVL
jgi:uncharacterized protein YbjT (DUF2867 family)